MPIPPMIPLRRSQTRDASKLFRSVHVASLGFFLALLGLASSALAQPWVGSSGAELKITSRNGKPVADATVLLLYLPTEPPGGPGAVLTDSKGIARLGRLADGPWRLRVDHPEYMSFVGVLSIRGSKKADLSSTALEKTGTSFEPLRVKTAKYSGGASSRAPELEPTLAKTPDPETPSIRTTSQPEPEVVEPAAAPAPTPTTTTRSPATRGPTAEDLAADDQAPADPTTPDPSAPAAMEESLPDMATEAIPETSPALPELEVENEPTATPDPPSLPPAQTPAGTVSPPTTPPDATITETAIETLPPSEVTLEESIDEVTDVAEQAEPPSLPALQEPATPPLPDAVPNEELSESPEALAVEMLDPTISEAATPDIPLPAATGASQPLPPNTTIPRVAASMRSASSGNCPECQPGEESLSLEVAVASNAAGCDLLDEKALGDALERLHANASASLQNFLGPAVSSSVESALDYASPSIRTSLLEELGVATDPRSGCQAVIAVLPRGARYIGFGYEARDDAEYGNCRSAETCSIGAANWLKLPVIRRMEKATFVYGIFRNDHPDLQRSARLTVYYLPRASGQRR